jgi:hypothetical protein
MRFEVLVRNIEIQVLHEVLSGRIGNFAEEPAGSVDPLCDITSQTTVTVI